MPHRGTSVAIRQAITQALNVTQGHKRSYHTSYYSNLNATQGHKRSYQTSYYSGSKYHTGTQTQLSNKILLRL